MRKSEQCPSSSHSPCRLSVSECVTESQFPLTLYPLLKSHSGQNLFFSIEFGTSLSICRSVCSRRLGQSHSRLTIVGLAVRHVDATHFCSSTNFPLRQSSAASKNIGYMTRLSFQRGKSFDPSDGSTVGGECLPLLMLASWTMYQYLEDRRPPFQENPHLFH